jgi:hypothetical protein
VFNIKGGDVLTSIIRTDPLDVAHLKSTLILLVQPVNDVPVGALIELVFPATGILSFDNSVYTKLPPCYFQGTEPLPDVVDCTIVKNGNG